MSSLPTVERPHWFHAGRMAAALWACILALFLCAPASARVTKVLMISGDWKSQAWYQDVWMGGKGENGKGTPPVYYRGRLIAKKVEAAAPGQFEFTDITNYEGQEYVDANYLSQFDVLLVGDLQLWTVPERFNAGIREFVRNGGGLIYVASYKWHTAMVKGTGFDEPLPTDFSSNNLADDWQKSQYVLAGEKNFNAQVASADHPAIRGLAWADAPKLAQAYKLTPKPRAQVLLKTPGGAPLLVAGTFGKGRAITSASIWANDEVSPGFGDAWPDFGKYYAQVFGWLGENSTNEKAALKDTTAQFNVTIDAAASKLLNAIVAGIFSTNSTDFPPNLGGKDGLQGEALKNFQALNPTGGFARFNPQGFQTQRGKFDYAAFDRELAESKRLGLENDVVFDDLFWVPWIWTHTATSNWGEPTDQEVADCVEYVAALLEHANHGHKGVAGYDPAVKYIEVGNEPGIDGDTIDGYVKLFKAVAGRVHRDYPDVQVGALGGYEVPYIRWFIDRAGADVDFIVRHPYGWTGEGVFAAHDQYLAYAKQKGHPQIKMFITEWDYWIAGRPKFDYMMKRYFEAVQREGLIGTLHYRLDEYTEPVYIFGLLWAGFGPGAGASGTPMHDAYDALWAFKDFRGNRVPVSKAAAGADVSLGLAGHLMADAARDGDRVNAVLYYDWAYQGSGYADYKAGTRYPKVTAKVTIALAPPATDRERTATVATANCEGFKVLKESKIAAGRRELTEILELDPGTAVTVTVR